jgi:prevent-host-death family protein
MTTTTATHFRSNLFRYLKGVIQHHDPLHVTTKDGDAVVLSESDYNALQETLYLVSVPKLREELMQGMAAPLDECVIDDGDEW